ncbi:Phosphatidylinositol-glycan biosynthesis class S protein [Arabidopsis suecica]|uniref:Phosphatidylinositol-glycan biosynthesis class S protein n=1 Tax=Arabidopsis suecica TaxID=45249 RepID=A0A8T1XPS7_ARASU|nr:Phosphatidylinositol-glycan biosynthesis class S protein [Arabidopsis suecica]
MWGGVIMWNPGNCDKDSESSSRNTISPQDIEQIDEVFLGQLVVSLSLKPFLPVDWSNASLGGYSSSTSSSRMPSSIHPSIMCVSYFSCEHCFAVSSPFFLLTPGQVILAACFKNGKDTNKRRQRT